ncbi:MAG: hypothetical protein JSW71_01310 [Gemmatimonadota bacterium]|nr:MAG: hypothetical protein JSW71_01310 [Gemmatimonadota bacterium]
MTGLLAGAGLTVVSAAATGQDDAQNGPESRWYVLSRPHVDLWYHGLALVGYEQARGMPLYNAQYVDRVLAVKDSLGVRTKLDKDALDFLGEFQDDDVFQSLHFLPLYFPLATPERMLRALAAVAERDNSDTSLVGPDTRAGLRFAAANFRSGDQRKVLGRFVEALEEEWDKFYREYWDDHIHDPGLEREIQRRWDATLAPAVDGFLVEQRLKNGRIFVSPPLGPEGRLVRGNAFQGVEHAVAVWEPEPRDTTTSLYSAVRELCFSVVNGGQAAVRCGAMLLQQTAPELVPEYQRVFVNAVGGDTSAAGLAQSFEESFAVAGQVVEQLEENVRREEPAAVEDEEYEPPITSWVVRPRAHVDLWFHSMAVIQADQPGPLGLYSADYAREIREVKQSLGLYPTPLDSLAERFREQIGEAEGMENIHFIPLWFPRADDPQQMLEALKAVANQDFRGPEARSRVTAAGVQQVAFSFDRGGERSLLRRLVAAVEREWDLFYRDYWEDGEAIRAGRYDAIQQMWDDIFAERLAPYLENRRLTGGLIVPSPAIGPEGRIVELDDYNPQDQIVSVQLPPNNDNPDATVFAFLKELCFLMLDDRRLIGFVSESAVTAADLNPDEQGELQDLRRTAAVRCGAYIMEFHAPIHAARYRRVFLDAVGAEESSTVAAFERVYFLPPEVEEVVREQIRRR